MEAAVIGVGLHPFGRFPGKSAMDMGADAVRLALADAGITWPQVQAGWIGSYEVANPDAIVGRLVSPASRCAECSTAAPPPGPRSRRPPARSRPASTT
jgi:acetyl-CoA acetyltransferase